MRVVVLQKLQQTRAVALARHAQVIDDRSLRGWAQAVEPCRQFGDQPVRVSRKRQCRLGHKLRVMEVVTPLDRSSTASAKAQASATLAKASSEFCLT